MFEITVAAIGDTIKKFEEQIENAQTVWEKIQLFFSTYKVWILVGLVVIVGIVFFVTPMEAKKRKDERDDRKKSWELKLPEILLCKKSAKNGKK